MSSVMLVKTSGSFLIRGKHLICRRQWRHFHVTLENIYNHENKSRCQELFHKTPSWYSKAKSSYRRTSAVLIPLCHVNGEPSLLFMKRSCRVRSHRGDVSFPGGITDHSDQSAVDTALREAKEEVDLDPHRVDVWGMMASLPTRASVLATPVVGYCGELDVAALKPCDKEVELIFTRTIQSLCVPENVRQTTFRGTRRGTLTVPGYTMPVFLGGDHKIWGLTAVFLHYLLTVIAPGLYNFKMKHPRLHHDRHFKSGKR